MRAAGQKNVVVYSPYLAPVDLSYDATWKERTRYENMLVLKLNNEKHKGQTPNRDDFPLAARMLAVSPAPRRKEGIILSLRRTNENDNDHSMKNCDQNLSGKVGITGKSTGRRHHLHLQQIGDSQETGMNHNEKNGMISSGGKSGIQSL